MRRVMVKAKTMAQSAVGMPGGAVKIAAGLPGNAVRAVSGAVGAVTPTKMRPKKALSKIEEDEKRWEENIKTYEEEADSPAGTAGSTQNASAYGKGGRQEAQGSQAGDVWFLY